eukprot:scaffold3557_cov54-Cylindrotheca_fusiformis.AAC.1
MEDSLSASSSSSVLILSEYEKLRERNIQRNNARLKALGLLSPHNHHSNEENENERKSNKPSQKHKRRRRRPLSTSNDNDGSGNTAVASGRKSLRLQGKEPTNAAGIKLLHWKEESPDEQPRRKPSKQTRPKKTDDDKENSQVSFSSSLDEEATIYQHTLMRIQSMTEKALKRRIQVIERAAGKQCFIKMKMFQQCLQDNEMWELADLAKNALERLLQKKKKKKQK